MDTELNNLKSKSLRAIQNILFFVFDKKATNPIKNSEIFYTYLLSTKQFLADLKKTLVIVAQKT
jgi:hypothetical protein